MPKVAGEVGASLHFSGNLTGVSTSSLTPCERKGQIYALILLILPSRNPLSLSAAGCTVTHMKTKTLLVVALMAFFVGLRTLYAQVSPKPFQPFLLTEAMSSPRSGSPLPYLNNFILAVRDDGSWVRITPYINIAEKTVYGRDIYDMRTKIWTTVDDLSKSTLTRQMTEHQISTLRAVPAASCGGKAAGTILGQNVEYVETEDDSEDRRITVKKWEATALGCTAMRQETIMKEKRGDVWTLTVDTTNQAISLVFEPVDQFFQVPNDFTERKPSEVYQELHRLYPKQFDFIPDMTGADVAYQEKHVELNH
jgi:hypothetical protein